MDISIEVRQVITVNAAKYALKYMSDLDLWQRIMRKQMMVYVTHL